MNDFRPAPPTTVRRLSRLLVAGSALLLGACAIVEPLPQAAPELPATWQEAGTASASDDFLANAQWWQQFGAEELDALQAQARQSAPELLVQAERVIQAELALRQAGASLLPGLTLGGGSGVQKSGGNESRSTNASFNARYEIDLWGRLAALRTASSANLQASRFDQDAAALSLSANLASLWFQSLALVERIAIAEDNLAIARRVLAIVDARYRQGAASALELSQQRSTVLAQEKAIDPLKVAYRQTHSALALLLGRTAGELPASTTTLAQLQLPTIAPGLPASLLLRRPDLAASEARLHAAAANVAAARAALLPSISLTAGASAASAELLSLSGHHSVLSLSGTLLQTIFDGGRLAADVDIQRSRQRELVENYRHSVRTALKEVEDALADNARDQAQESLQQAIVEEAERSLRLAELRYREGAGNLLSVLDAQRSLFAAQDQLIQVRLARLNDAVALYRALGGGWQVSDGAGAAQG